MMFIIHDFMIKDITENLVIRICCIINRRRSFDHYNVYLEEKIRFVSINLNPNLKDPDVIPSDDIIISLVGERIKLWQSVLNYAYKNNINVSGDWHYYNDGKQWLFKLVQKKKTIFWAGIIENSFRITFYFGDKAEEIIEESDLPASIKDEFKNAKRFGSIRGITVRINESADTENVFRLINIKGKIK